MGGGEIEGGVERWSTLRFNNGKVNKFDLMNFPVFFTLHLMVLRVSLSLACRVLPFCRLSCSSSSGRPRRRRSAPYPSTFWLAGGMVIMGVHV